MNRRALIVDDNRALAEDLGEILELEGYDVAVFDDPALALAECQDKVFDVALLDVRMPGLDGVGLHRKLLERHPNTVFILMTAYTEDDRIASALAAGVKAVLMKPVPLADLLQALGESEQPQGQLLLIDDDTDFTEALAEVLVGSGYRVQQAHNLAQARGHLGNAELTAVIVDVRLPDGDGAEFAVELARSSDIPVLIVSGYELSDHDSPLVQELGERVRMLTKPFPPDTLLKALLALRGEPA